MGNTVHLPDNFEEAIQISLNTKQNITRTKKLVENVKVKLGTQVMVAHKNANATIAKARGDASAVLQQAWANANMTVQTVTAAAKGYSKVKTDLSFQNTAAGSNSSELPTYVYNDALSAMSNSQYLVGAAPGSYINSAASASASVADVAE